MLFLSSLSRPHVDKCSRAKPFFYSSINTELAAAAAASSRTNEIKSAVSCDVAIASSRSSRSLSYTHTAFTIPLALKQ